MSDRLAHGDEPASQTANYQIVLLDQNGQQMSFPGDTGNLVPHITAAQRNALISFMASLREQAEGQILGG